VALAGHLGDKSALQKFANVGGKLPPNPMAGLEGLASQVADFQIFREQT
jgi:hypothetical protein